MVVGGNSNLPSSNEAAPSSDPSSSAIALEVARLAQENEALVARLAAEQMTLTVCPLSNLKLCVVPSLAQHPIRRMLSLGLHATINSDDPAYFGGYLLENFAATAEAVGLTRAEVITLARNSITGSFLDAADKNRHLAALPSA